jgi:hypothetical protein
VKPITTCKFLIWRPSPLKYSPLSLTIMTSFQTVKTDLKHLTDVDIGKILGLAKAKLSQQKIASIMKFSQ